MGIFPNSSLSTVFEPRIDFYLYQCVNSTSNNNSCASQEEIDQMIKYAYVQKSTPTTLYDFTKSKKPQKNIYDYHFTYLDKSMLKYYDNSFTTTILFIDYGIISDDYQSVSTNFNPNIDYDPNIRQENDPLFQFSFKSGINFQMNYLRNQKLNDIIGSLGGLNKIIILLGKLLSMTYNSIYLRFKIINSTFSYSKKDKTEIFPKGMTESMTSSKTSIISKIAKNFSYCSYLFPSKDVRKFNQLGSKHLHEYLDIRKIISRLQDLDKLKMILLTEDQRRLFEYLPKPDVVDSKKKFSIDSIRKHKTRVKTRKTTKTFSNTMKSMVEGNDPINKRILECLYQKIIDKQEKLNKNDGNTNFLAYSIFYLL